MANDSNQRKAEMAEASRYRRPPVRYNRERLRKEQLRRKEAELWPAQRRLIVSPW